MASQSTAKPPLTEKDRKEFNAILRELQILQADIEKALSAGLEEVQPLHDACVGCQERIASVKAQYFPNKA